MSATQKLLNIMNQTKTQLEDIDGGDDYNNTVKHDNIIIGYKSVNEIRSTPFICIVNPGGANLRPTDQITYEGQFYWEIYAYVKNQGNEIESALKMFGDIEKVMFNNPEMKPSDGDNLVYNLTIDKFDVGGMNDYGVVFVRFMASGFYTHY